ncbi:MAG: hypothetical protein Q9187_007268 [Circinaria calcarea]
MSVSTLKRQRSNTNGDSAPVVLTIPFDPKPSPEKIEKLIQGFDEKTVRQLLLSAALDFPSLTTELEAKQATIVQAQSAKVINFNRYSEDVLNELASGDGLKGSKQFELSGKVCRAITETIGEIRAQCPRYSSFETKRSALETLRKIGGSICCGDGDTLGSEVIKWFQYDSCLEDTMLEIVKGMTEEEKERMRTSSESFVDELSDLIEHGRSRYLFENLGVVLKTLGGEGATYDNGDTESEEEEEEDEDEEEEEEDEKDEMDEETRDRMVRGNWPPYRNLCGGCGCEAPLCSSCWGDWGDWGDQT